MALNFPDSPTVGDIYTDNTSGFSYEWDGVVWKSYTPSATKNITVLDDISGSFDGIQTIFPITVSAVSFTPANAQQLRIVLGGVVQEPGSDYTVSGTSIVFTTPPTGGLSFSGVSLGPAVPVGVSTIGDVYNRNTYNPTGVQTTFTFTGGYTVGYLDVYQNGVRLSAGSDFTATDGLTFDLTVPANSPDEIEAIGYKISTIAITEGQLTNLFVTNNAQVIGLTTLSNVSVTNNLNVTGIVTASSFVGDGAGLTGNINTAGIITASSFVGDGSGLTEITYAASAGIATDLLGGNVGVNTTTTPTNLYVSGNAASNIVGLGTTNASTTLDFSLGNNFSLTLTGSIVLSNPTGVTTGQSGIIFIEQDGVGSHTVGFGSHWDFPSSTAPTLSTGANSLDCLTYIVRNSTSIVTNSLIGIGTL